MSSFLNRLFLFWWFFCGLFLFVTHGYSHHDDSSFGRGSRFVSFGKWHLNDMDYKVKIPRIRRKTHSFRRRKLANHPIVHDHSIIRCNSSVQTSSQHTLPKTTTTATSESLAPYLTEPLIQINIWNRLTGREWQEHPEQLDKLARMGVQLAKNDRSNEWIEWRIHGNQNNEKLEDGAIHVWTGRTHKTGYYGSELPFVKTRSIIPLSPKEMVDLMMDSSRVKEYNPWSIGRRDCWVSDDGYTKIVQNRVQPPLGAKPMISTTLLHACPIDNLSSSTSSSNPAWVIISRAVGGGTNAFPMAAANNDDHRQQYGHSEILLGVNLLEPIPGDDDDEDSCVFTAVNHMYSSAVPTVLAERVGVKSAIKFVKDMRKLKVPAS